MFLARAGKGGEFTFWLALAREGNLRFMSQGAAVAR